MVKALSTKLEGEELEFTCHKDMAEEYHLRAKKGFAWATITINKHGQFNAQSDFGSFSYNWGPFEKDQTPFKRILSSIMLDCEQYPQGYVYDKIKNLDNEGRVDMDTTKKNIKNEIINARREAGVHAVSLTSNKVCTREDARQLWNDIDRLPNGVISNDALFSELQHLESLQDHIIHWETFVYNVNNIIEYTYDTKALAFCTYIAPAFGKVLMKELEENNDNTSNTQSDRSSDEGISTSE